MIKKIMVFVAVIVISLGIFCACGEERIGTFYSIREALDNDLLSSDDLQNIAFYFNGRYSDEKFNRRPKTPENLNDCMIDKIKNTYRVKVLDMPKASLEQITVYDYYGTYNGYIAVGITDEIFCYDYVINSELIIGGVTFYNIHNASIRIWSEE